MTWVSWKQHRSELAIAAGIVVITVLVMTYVRFQMSDATRHLGLAACQNGSTSDANCSQLLNAFMDQFFGFALILRYFLTALPALLAIFVAAPLISREVEEHTHTFIWTQSITRSRWLSTKLLVLGAFTIVASALLSTFVFWWQGVAGVMYAYQGGTWTFFDIMGTTPVAYAVFALALGVAASATIQRTVPAMAATLLLFTAVRVAVYLIRPYFMPPQTLHLPGPTAALAGIWQIGATSFTGVSQTVTYQPATRFWTFQYVESAIFALLTCLLLVFATTMVRSRIR